MAEKKGSSGEKLSTALRKKSAQLKNSLQRFTLCLCDECIELCDEIQDELPVGDISIEIKPTYRHRLSKRVNSYVIGQSRLSER
jgi:ATP-dependent protease Clp ATPase subunit